MVYKLVTFAALPDPESEARLAGRLREMGFEPVSVSGLSSRAETHDLLQSCDAVALLINAPDLADQTETVVEIAKQLSLPIYTFGDGKMLSLQDRLPMFQLSSVTREELLDALEPEKTIAPPPKVADEYAAQARAKAEAQANTFRDPEGWAKWAITAIAPAALTFLLVGWHSFAAGLAAGKSDMDGMMLHAATIESLSICGIVCMLVAGIPFLMWVHRSFANLQATGNVDLPYTPGMAAGGFLIPFANLYIPFVVMQTLWKGTVADGDLSDPLQWKRVPASTCVALWGITWIGSSLLTRSVNSQLNMLESDKSTGPDYGKYVDRLQSVLWGLTASSLGQFLGGVLIIWLLVTICSRQWQRYERYAATVAGVTPIKPKYDNWVAPAVGATVLSIALVAVTGTKSFGENAVKAAVQEQKIEWEVVDRPWEGFSAELPGDIKKESADKDTFLALGVTVIGACQVVTVDVTKELPSGFPDDWDTVKDAVKADLEDLIPRVGRKEGSLKETRVGSTMAYALNFHPESEDLSKSWTYGRAIVLLHGKHLYRLIVFGTPGKEMEELETHFLSSFRVQ